LSNDGDAFISLDKLNDNCIERIYQAIENPISIEKYLQNFNKPKKTIYIKKKHVGPILIESDSEDTPVIKPKVNRKKKIIVEEEEDLSPSKPKKGKSKKQLKEKKNVSKKNEKY